MSSKKSNLTPELKEIYERVMSTTPAPKSSTPPPPPQTAPKPPTTEPTIAYDNSADQALSDIPIKPVSLDNAAFAFHGKADSEKNKSKLSFPVLIIIGVFFLLIWLVVWLVVFGYIRY